MRRRPFLTVTSLLLAGLLAIVGCSGGSPAGQTQRPANAPAADTAVAALVSGLEKGDLGGLQVVGGATAANADLHTIMAGMDGLKPSVVAGPVTYDTTGGDTVAHATLQQTYLLGAGTWHFSSQAGYVLNGDTWQLQWTPSIVHPQLTGATRLRHTRTFGDLAAITGASRVALVEEQPVVKIGIDKTRVAASKLTASATALAKLLQIDSTNYSRLVNAAGPQAFVVGLVVRQAEVPAGLNAIPGAIRVSATEMLAPTKTFARSILGTVGPATAQLAAASNGDVLPGETAGISGLLKRYDAQLRGRVGHTIDLVPRTSAGSASASGSGPASSGASSPASTAPGSTAPDSSAPDSSAPDSTGPGSSASGSPNPQSSPGGVVELFNINPTDGTPVATTLDFDLQTRAESAVANVSGIASLVVLNVSTGAILAAANSPGSNDNPDATFGEFAPGSTFKVITSLALLRKGLTPSTMVPCPLTIAVNGKSFKNYSDFPASKIGTISLTDALANSCNTAFIGQSSKLSGTDLASAAASLGVGVDYNSGFTSFYGSVPAPPDVVTKAADAIGQGQILASPMAMAAVAASVGSGHTVIPYLVVASKPTAKASLSASEARALSTMMRAVVTSGSGRGLQGLVTGAKTGTAEYGTASLQKTHAWMIAFNGRYAICAMVNDGVSGAKSAAPIIKAFLAG